METYDKEEGSRYREQEVITLAQEFEYKLVDFARSRGFSATINDLYPTQEKYQEIIQQNITQLVDALFAKIEPYVARIASALEVANQLETQRQLVQLHESGNGDTGKHKHRSVSLPMSSLCQTYPDIANA